MDPRKLIYFATVVEHGSLKKAAPVLRISQPALSNSISRLEAEVGHKLLDRGPSGVSPTALGDRIYAHARQIRDEIEHIERHLVDRHPEPSSGIRFGALPSLSVSVIPAAVARWRAIYPKASLQVVQKVQIELLQALIARELDFIVGVSDFYDLLNGLKLRVLFRERLHVIARSGHPLFAKADLSWPDLAGYPWITPPAGRFNTLLDDILRTEGVPPPDATTFSSSISMLKCLVANGDSLALLPLHAVVEEIREGKLACLPISSPLLNRNIALFTREGYEMQTPHGDLIECTRSVGLEICRSGMSPPNVLDVK